MAAQFARAPHRGATSGPVQTAPNAALLIDFDNVTMGIRSDLSKELKNLLNSDIIKGKVAVQRAYADWRRYPQYIVPLAEASVDLIFAPAYGSSKKNATDIRLAIDALELVFTRPEIGTFILLSGDSDFSSLVLKLKEYGKYVIGVGIRESASDLLVQNCDEYYSYSVLTGLTKEGEETVERLDPWVLVERAVRQMAEQGDVMRSDRLKQVMIELDPNFNEKDLGYSKFSKFLSDAVARGCLHLRKVDNGQWEVAPVEKAPEVAAASVAIAAEPEPREERAAREESRRSRGRGRDRDRGRPAEARDAEGRKGDVRDSEPRAQVREAQPVADADDPLAASYALLRRAVAGVIEATGGPARDSDVKRRMLELAPDWDESAVGFSKFSRFLRQAHDAEVINLHKTGNGTYEVELAGGRATVRSEARRGRAAEEPAAQRKPEPEARAAADAKAEAKPEPRAESTAASKAGDAVKPETPAAAERRDDARAAGAADAAAQGRSEAAPMGAAAPRARLAPRSPLGIGFRVGSTRARMKIDGPPPLLPGQTLSLQAIVNGKAETVSEPAKPQEAPRVEATAPKTAAAGSPAKEDATKASTAAAKATAGAPEFAGLPTDAEGVVRYLSGRYKGVGQKTAEQLVEVFGAAGVFQALHTEPDRVREVLGARRAEALLAGWKSDLEQRRAEAAAVIEEAARSAAAAKARSAARSAARRSRGGSRKSAAAGTAAETQPTSASAEPEARAAQTAAAAVEEAGTAKNSRGGAKGKSRQRAAQAAAAKESGPAGAVKEEARAETAPSPGDAGGAAAEDGTKKAGRSRGRRGGRKRSKAKAAAGGAE